MAGAWVKKTKDVPPPIYRFMFSDDYAFGLPPREYALDTYLELLRDEVGDAPWIAAGLGHDVRGLIPQILERGGGIRVGLEDAPLAAGMHNIEWVEQARQIIEDQGFELASPEEVRRATASGRATGMQIDD